MPTTPDNRQPVTVRLDPDRYQWLRRYAFDQETSQQRVMEDALDLYRRTTEKESSS